MKPLLDYIFNVKEKYTMKFTPAHIEAIKNMTKNNSEISIGDSYTLIHIKSNQIPHVNSFGSFLIKKGEAIDYSKLTGTFFYESFETCGKNIDIYVEGRVLRTLYEPNIFNYENHEYTFNKTGLNPKYVEAITILYNMADEHLNLIRRSIDDMEKEKRNRAAELL